MNNQPPASNGAGSDQTPVEAELAALRAATVDNWLKVALEGDLNSSLPRADESALEEELRRMRQTLSWRITAPLRAVRRKM
ncbi:hypothetical protein [Diaminobutyricimonas sp. TR449]|uniref:hypothetical protein n=1 Tax=Diaminobutyricimonas sp. TR449 TaxID=2708076 RepID=UPI0014226B2B|nr:hypothetical protein [Diaminobutyricimonas sp. TR449]